MSDPSPGRAAPSSYLGGALRDPVNQIALGVVLGVALIVGLASRFPFSEPFSIQLADPPLYLVGRHVALVGFELPCTEVCTTASPKPRLVFNRALPGAFELAIQGRRVSTPKMLAPGDFEIRLGDRSQPIAFGPDLELQRLHFENPLGLRSIELSLPPGRRVALAQIAVRPEAKP